MPPPFTMPRRPTMGLDPAALVPRGSTGPMGPPQIPGNTSGMLIPGTRPGSAIWAPGQPVPGQVPEAQVDAVLPPQRPQFGPMPTAPMMPRGMPSLNDRASASDGAVRTGPLSMRGAVPVGRGMTPQRRMEMFQRRAWTRGDEGAAMGITSQMAQMDQRQQMQQQGMDFAAKQNETNFQQGLVMNDLGQRAQSARDAQQSQERFAQWLAEQEADKAREERGQQWDMTKFGMEQGAQAMRDAREQQQREQERITGFEMLPGPNGMGLPVLRTQGGAIKQTGGGPIMPAKPDAPLPPGARPTSTKRGDTTYQFPGNEPPKPPDGIQYEKDAAGNITGGVYPVQDPQTGKWKLTRIDLDGDGVISPAEAAKAKAGANAAGAPATAPASSFLKSFGS